MGKLFDKILHGGPEHQKRKFEQDYIKEEARKARLQGVKEGMIEGARKAGKAEGMAKAQRKGGFMGTMDRIGAGMQSFEKNASPFVGDIDFGGMGSSPMLGGGMSAFGMDLGGGRPKSPHKPGHRHSKRRRSKRR